MTIVRITTERDKTGSHCNAISISISSGELASSSSGRSLLRQILGHHQRVCFVSCHPGNSFTEVTRHFPAPVRLAYQYLRFFFEAVQVGESVSELNDALTD